MKRIRIGSRGSDLALVQANHVVARLREADPELTTELVIIQTTGDRVTDRPLTEVGGAGIFIKEIEAALLEDRIDAAVHSMKDVPSRLGEGLTLAATLERVDPRDALVSRGASSIEALTDGATVATGSLRRRSQLLSLRPDLVVEDLRGNVPTRLDKFDASTWEAVVLAAAGLVRLGLGERIAERIPPDTMLPAVGQGALAIETRSDDAPAIAAVEALSHAPTARAIEAERAFLARLEGGCQVPIAAYAELDSRGELRLQGFVGSVDGQRSFRGETRGPAAEAAARGEALADVLLEDGAGAVLRELGGGA